MLFVLCCDRRVLKCVVIASVVSFVFTFCVPSISRCQDPADCPRNEIDKWFSDNWTRQSEKQYDDAIRILKTILACKDIDGSHQNAYKDLVFVYHQKDSTAAAELIAEEALERYPSLSVGAYHDRVPLSLDALYFDPLRKKMFGRLVIRSDPDSCQVILDGQPVGVTPFDSALVRVRPEKYELVLKKSGYKERTDSVEIKPGELPKAYTLEWIRPDWFKRLLAFSGALITTVVALWISDPFPKSKPATPIEPPPAPPE